VHDVMLVSFRKEFFIPNLDTVVIRFLLYDLKCFMNGIAFQIRLKWEDQVQ